MKEKLSVSIIILGILNILLVITVWIVTIFIPQIAAAKDISNAQIQIYGNVPVIVRADILQKNFNVYDVHEVSNDSNGYVVMIYTDSSSVTYDGVVVQINSNTAVITNVYSQQSTIDIHKQLILTSPVTFVRISAIAN